MRQQTETPPPPPPNTHLPPPFRMLMPLLSTLWEKHNSVVNNTAKQPKTIVCKHDPMWQIQNGNGWKQHLACGLRQQPNGPFFSRGLFQQNNAKAHLAWQRDIVIKRFGCIMKPINYQKEDPMFTSRWNPPSSLKGETTDRSSGRGFVSFRGDYGKKRR